MRAHIACGSSIAFAALTLIVPDGFSRCCDHRNALTGGDPYSYSLDGHEEQAEAQRGKDDLKAFAGVYFHGDGLGDNHVLDLRPEGRFSFRWLTDAGPNYQDDGTAELVDGYLILHPRNHETSRRFFDASPPKLLPVEWGARRYLLSDEDMLRFCNAVNLGAEPRVDTLGLFYLQPGSPKDAQGERPEMEQARGLPKVPAKWTRLLLEKRIHGEVVEELKDRKVTINLGRKNGVWEGMFLIVFRGEKSPASDPFGHKCGVARVLTVEAESCTARIVRQGSSSGAGMVRRVSSRIPERILCEVDPVSWLDGLLSR